ncbi:hypothetical protein ACJZ2D_016451 [Fusarium nematophilum]
MHLDIGWLRREIAASSDINEIAYRIYMIPEISHAIKTDPRIRTDLAPAFQLASVPLGYSTPAPTPPEDSDPRPLSPREQTPCYRSTTEPNNPPLQAQGQVGDKHDLQRDVPRLAKRTRLDEDRLALPATVNIPEEAHPSEGTRPSCKTSSSVRGKPAGRRIQTTARKQKKQNNTDPGHTQQPSELSWLPCGLQEAIQRAKTLQDLQNAWDLCFALRNQPLLVCAGESPTLEELWQAYTQYERMEENAHAIKVLSRLEAGEVPRKPSKVKAEFIAKMFPKDQKRQKYAQRGCQDPIRSFNHQMYVARRLSDLVTHFGCGVLLYPGFEMTIFDIAKVTNDRVDDLIDFIHRCHPRLKDEVSNLSKILPKLIIWGAPAFHLAIEQIPRDRLEEFQARSINDLIQVHDMPEEYRIQGEPDFDGDMSKWHGSDDLWKGMEW